MNKRGFTLTELIVVIIILGILTTIAVPSVISISQKIKGDMFCSKVENIISAAKLYGDDKFNNIIELSDAGLTIDNLKDALKNKNESTLSNYETNKYIIYTNVLELVQNNKISKDNDNPPYVIDPRDDSDITNKKVVIYKKNNRIYALYELSTEEEQLCS